MRPTLYTGLVVSLVGLAARPSLARSPSVFINGVKVDGLSGQRLSNVDVVFDSAGDVHISAKGYKVQAADGERAAATPPSTAAASASAPTTGPAPPAASAGSSAPPAPRRFFIAAVVPRGRAAMVGWDIDVFINQQFVKRFRSKDLDPLVDITRFLRQGPNVVHFTANREPGERASASADDYFELVLGDGEMRGGEVMLNKISAYRRTAAESGTFNSETTLNLSSAPSL